MFSWRHNSRKYLLSTIWLQDCKQGNILGKYGRMHLPKKDQQTQILYECVTSLAKNLHILLVIPFIYTSHTNRSETSISGNLASYHDNCHHLRTDKILHWISRSGRQRNQEASIHWVSLIFGLKDLEEKVKWKDQDKRQPYFDRQISIQNFH